MTIKKLKIRHMAETIKETIKFNLAELIALDTELVGTETFKGLLGLKLSLTTKYYLTKIAKITGEEKQIFEKMRDELIQELGEETKPGYFEVPQIQTIKGENGEKDQVVMHPNYIKYREQVDALLSEEKIIEKPNLKIEDFESLETEGNFPAFFKLLGL